ncbi:PIG-L family deacetylase [Romboutsia weinsteinii]|uniref:PIG-L family deacetylase n=1 Tax=Romboutsia weinsteinii TaxID=2020949 RepID=A0A371J878_9FIRM|nr:PIG-L family deacetylase [Romboutsia weinsteinii]RDY28981.1 PIG-L family deacetylase [Romboutsia weinsteinii]
MKFKEILKNNKSKLKNKNILKKSLFIPIVLCAGLALTGFSSYSNHLNMQFKDYVVFYPQHQDDEVLWAGSAIVEAIKERGQDNIFVVQVSNGSGISVFRKNEKYKDLTREEKTEYRKKEFLASVEKLGVKKENVVILSDINKSDTTDFSLMEKVALEFEHKFKSVTHIAHTYKLDNHLQHIKNGSVIQSLYNSGQIKDAKYFVKPKFANQITMGKKIVYKADSKEEYEKVKNSCDQYKLIDESLGREGIGYKSDHKSFDNLVDQKSVPAILHTTGL